MPVSVRAKVAPPIVVRRSRIQGRGVFATRSIAAGERIVEYLGARLTHEEADAECPDDEASVRHHTFLFAVDDHMVIDGGRNGNDARFINHSCEPNCEVVINRQRVFIHALRDIRTGEELLYDYWYLTDESYTLSDLRRIYPCRCGSESCRGTLARPLRGQKKRARSR
ncbi:MAG TPA: SET domain-containing protein-lysine N-methyltransferase [Polyangiaceae bacterium]|nr:SET domain-containing protein-lysine N-methyltransferase [Polyangiaceae bacterium]